MEKLHYFDINLTLYLNPLNWEAFIHTFPFGHHYRIGPFSILIIWPSKDML